MTIEDIEREIVDEFDLFESWLEKYEYLIELGKDLPLIESSEQTDENFTQNWRKDCLSLPLILTQ